MINQPKTIKLKWLADLRRITKTI